MTKTNPRPCSIDGCGKMEKARGLCPMHYARWRIHGNPLFTKFDRAVEGAPRSFMESIPMTGEGCVTWPFATNGSGYAQINIGNGKKALVSRIICERKNGPPPSSVHQAAHECGKGHKGCIAPWHLTWKLPIENAADLDVHGTRRIGDDCPYAKLTSADVLVIRALANVIPQHRIGKRFGISQTGVSKIILRKIWASV